MTVKKLVDSDYGRQNVHVTRRGDLVDVTLTYPPYTDADNKDGRIRYIEVDQESVRASDGIRLFYDYERDGWVVQQGSRLSWKGDDEICDRDWQEVAFIQSWARQETDEQEAARLSEI